MKTIIILLAAGESSRTTNMKQLYKIDGQYLINRQIDILQSYGYDIVVILGHRYEKIKAVLHKNIETIENRNYKNGMFSSVQTAFQYLEVDKFIFCHIDRPIVSKEIFEQLIASDDMITTTLFNHKKAPPIMINYLMKEEILNTTHTRLDFWIESTNKALYIDVDDERVHFNANTDQKLGQYFG